MVGTIVLCIIFGIMLMCLIAIWIAEWQENAIKLDTVVGCRKDVVYSHFLSNWKNIYNNLYFNDDAGNKIMLSENKEYKTFYVKDNILPDDRNLKKGNIVVVHLNEIITPTIDYVPIGVYSVSPAGQYATSNILNITWVKCEINSTDSATTIKSQLHQAALAVLQHPKIKYIRQHYSYPGDKKIIQDFLEQADQYISKYVHHNANPNDLIVYITSDMDGDMRNNTKQLHLRIHSKCIGKAVYSFNT